MTSVTPPKGGSGDASEFVKLAVSELWEGATLAGNIYVGNLLLLRKGQIITNSFIMSLVNRGISHINIGVYAARELRAAKPDAAPGDPTLDAIIDELSANERDAWERAGVESTVSEKLLKEASKCVEDVFYRFREGRDFNLDDAKSYVADIIESVVSKPHTAIKLLDVELHDQYTFLHSVNVGLIFLALCNKQIGSDKLEDLTMGAVFHDVGKTKVPVELLNKNGALTQEEFEIVKKHAKIGYDMLSALGGFSDEALEIVHHHHERWDGSGYPDKLKEKEISPNAQLAAVCDVYDALTTSRPYRNKMDFASAMSTIIKASGKHFSPSSVNKLWTTLGLYPVGTFVKLNTGDIGVVRNVNPDFVTMPIVAILYDTNLRSLDTPKVVNLQMTREISIERALKPRHSNEG
jgi:putative nucleotidyltransferase with HDIG domain